MNSIDDRKHSNISQYKWKKTIAQWLASKQSAKIFCLERDLNESTFYYWHKGFDPDYPSKGRASPLRKTSERQAFIPVVLENRKPSRPKTGIKFYYPNGCFMVLIERLEVIPLQDRIDLGFIINTRQTKTKKLQKIGLIASKV